MNVDTLPLKTYFLYRLTKNIFKIFVLTYDNMLTYDHGIIHLDCDLLHVSALFDCVWVFCVAMDTRPAREIQLYS